MENLPLEEKMKDDLGINPAHYKSKGLEVIDVMEAFDLDFCRAFAIKYILRAEKKHASPILDIEKAIWYLERYVKQKENSNVKCKSV